MKIRITIFIVLFQLSFFIEAQDQPKIIPILPSEQPEENSPFIPKENSLDQPVFPNFKFNENTSESTIDFSPSSNFSVAPKEKFANEGHLYLNKLKKRLPTDTNDNEKKRQGATLNQFLGDIRYAGKQIVLVVRDHQYEDGDLVSIAINDQIKVQRTFLTNKPKALKVTLEEGFNKIDFTALNQGTSGPNTAELRIYDSNQKLLAINQWNLATGVKATMVIVRE